MKRNIVFIFTLLAIYGCESNDNSEYPVSNEDEYRIEDYLFVNKIKYGTRIPDSLVSFPFEHNKLPLLDSGQK